MLSLGRRGQTALEFMVLMAAIIAIIGYIANLAQTKYWSFSDLRTERDLELLAKQVRDSVIAVCNNATARHKEFEVDIGPYLRLILFRYNDTFTVEVTPDGFSQDALAANITDTLVFANPSGETVVVETLEGNCTNHIYNDTRDTCIIDGQWTARDLCWDNDTEVMGVENVLACELAMCQWNWPACTVEPAVQSQPRGSLAFTELTAPGQAGGFCASLSEMMCLHVTTTDDYDPGATGRVRIRSQEGVPGVSTLEVLACENGGCPASYDSGWIVIDVIADESTPTSMTFDGTSGAFLTANREYPGGNYLETPDRTAGSLEGELGMVAIHYADCGLVEARLEARLDTFACSVGDVPSFVFFYVSNRGDVDTDYFDYQVDYVDTFAGVFGRGDDGWGTERGFVCDAGECYYTSSCEGGEPDITVEEGADEVTVTVTYYMFKKEGSGEVFPGVTLSTTYRLTNDCRLGVRHQFDVTGPVPSDSMGVELNATDVWSEDAVRSSVFRKLSEVETNDNEANCAKNGLWNGITEECWDLFTDLTSTRPTQELCEATGTWTEPCTCAGYDTEPECTAVNAGYRWGAGACLYNWTINGEDEDTCEYKGVWDGAACTANGKDVSEHRPSVNLCLLDGTNWNDANGTWTTNGTCSDPDTGDSMPWREYDFQCGPGAAGEWNATYSLELGPGDEESFTFIPTECLYNGTYTLESRGSCPYWGVWNAATVYDPLWGYTFIADHCYVFYDFNDGRIFDVTATRPTPELCALTPTDYPATPPSPPFPAIWGNGTVFVYNDLAPDANYGIPLNVTLALKGTNKTFSTLVGHVYKEWLWLSVFDHINATDPKLEENITFKTFSTVEEQNWRIIRGDDVRVNCTGVYTGYGWANNKVEVKPRWR